ncbi:hypothetical protein CHS0354_007606 [Potamilus streckersoni]|uniref:Uncharacterized protein n=1 Tax=Potamilus streckersoni TaxID=2493646 RepID=A0AAE0T3T4_9BIVA|nr:hypothetical protein CHS0354_007606 [Potamilus streckersoni]
MEHVKITTLIFVTMNIPEYYEDLSIRLTEVLDASGLRDDLRWWRIRAWLQIEELERIWIKIIAGTNDRVHCFGGQAEATTTHGLLSDIDRLVVLNYTILQDLQF